MNKILLLLCISLCALNVNYAQLGSIKGIVSDQATGEFIPFVNVLVNETGSGTNTDLDGNFEIQLPEGSYSLQVSFLGYATVNVTDVKIKENEVTSLTIVMAEETEVLQEIVVKAKQLRDTEAAVLAIQRKSVNLLDGISNQTFKKIGDSNAANAVKRVTGVSVQDGKYVFIRGLSDRYTKSNLNSTEIPGLDPDRNTLQMDIFPTNILDNILVYKSFTPNLSGDFTGGTIDIITKSYPESKTFKIDFGLGINPSMHFNNNYLSYPGSSTDFLGFDNGERSLPFDKETVIPSVALRDPALTELTSSFSNNWKAIKQTSRPNFNFGISYGDNFEKESHTIGFNAIFNYKNTTSFFEDAEFNTFQKPDAVDEYQMVVERNQKGDLGVNNVLLTGLLTAGINFGNSEISLSAMHLQNGVKSAGKFDQETFLTAVNTIVRDNLEYTQRSLTNLFLNGRHSFANNKLQFNWRISPSLSKINDKDVRLTPFRVEGNSYNIEPSEGAVPQRIYRDLQETNLIGKQDFELDLSEGDGSNLKFGFSEIFKERDYGILNYQFNVQRAQNIDFSGDPNEILLPENLWETTERSGVYVIGNFEPANTFNGIQSTLAAYAMHEWNVSSKFKAIYGLRAEKFTHKYTGQNNQGSIIYDNEILLDEIALLPSVSLNYNLSDLSKFRLSYARTTARPSFKELSLAQIYDAISDRTFIGNLNLVTTDIDNYDIRWELFQNNSQKIAFSAFYKQFTNPIEIVAFSDAAPNDITPRNVGNARVSGLELEVKKNLPILTNDNQNLSISANVTWVKSRVEMDNSQGGELESRLRNARQGEEIKNTRQMQGQSPIIINSILGYEDSANGWNANLSYNVQGKRLSIVGINANPDVYELPFHSLTLKLSKAFGTERQFSVSLSGNNLLNSTRQRVYQSFGAKDEIFEVLRPQRSMSFSFSWNLR